MASGGVKRHFPQALQTLPHPQLLAVTRSADLSS